MIKALQVDPASDELQHVDLIRISMDKPIRVTVPVSHSGEPVGSRRGRLHRLRHPRGRGRVPAARHPESIGIDISELHISQSFKVQAMTVPAGVKVLTDPTRCSSSSPCRTRKKKCPRREAGGRGRGREPRSPRSSRRNGPRRKSRRNSPCGWSWGWATG